MSESIVTPQNIVELLKLFSVAVGSVVVAWKAITTQATSNDKALAEVAAGRDKAVDTVKELAMQQISSNDTLATAIDSLRVTQEKLCTKLDSLAGGR